MDRPGEGRAGKNIASKSKAGEKGVIKMQARQRGVAARKDIAQKHQAATKISAVGRGNAARKGMKKKQQAATKIGAVSRGRAARQSVKRQQTAATKINAASRGRVARRELKRKQTASSKIGSLRGRSIRSKTGPNIGSPPSAVKIQGQIRKKLATSKVQQRREAEREVAPNCSRKCT